MKRMFLIPLLIVLVGSLVFGGCAAPAPAQAPIPAPTPGQAPRPAPPPVPATPTPSAAPAAAPSPTAAPAPVPAKPIKLSFTSSLPPVMQPNWAEYAKRVNQRAAGRLIVDYKGGPEVISAKDQPEALRTGVLDMGALSTARLEPYATELGVSDLSQLSDAQEIEVGYISWIRELAAQKCNLYLFGKSGAYEKFAFITKKKVTRPQELAGQRMALTAMMISPCKGLGMVPVPTEVPDFYAALERGLVDATYSGSGGYGQMRDLAHYEVCKYFIDHLFYSNNFVQVVNLDTWNQIPKDLQDLLVEVYREVAQWNYDVTYKDSSADKQFLADHGVEFLTFSPEDADWYIKVAYDSKWAEKKERMSPESYNKLREMLIKPK